MYNPINMQVEDENRLQDKDLREKNKKQRYQARYIADVTVRDETLAEVTRLDNMSLTKVSHQRVAEELNRGFDILTNGGLRGGLAKMHSTGFMKQQPKAWDRITPMGNKPPALNNNNMGTEQSQQLNDFQAT